MKIPYSQTVVVPNGNQPNQKSSVTLFSHTHQQYTSQHSTSPKSPQLVMQSAKDTNGAPSMPIRQPDGNFVNTSGAPIVEALLQASKKHHTNHGSNQAHTVASAADKDSNHALMNVNNAAGNVGGSCAQILNTEENLRFEHQVRTGSKNDEEDRE